MGQSLYRQATPGLSRYYPRDGDRDNFRSRQRIVETGSLDTLSSDATTHDSAICRAMYARNSAFVIVGSESWRAAPMEAQQRAHQTCVEVLAMWLGRKPREEVAKTLSIPPMRVCQLSQQALCGMVAAS